MSSLVKKMQNSNIAELIEKYKEDSHGLTVAALNMLLMGELEYARQIYLDILQYCPEFYTPIMHIAESTWGASKLLANLPQESPLWANCIIGPLYKQHLKGKSTEFYDQLMSSKPAHRTLVLILDPPNALRRALAFDCWDWLGVWVPSITNPDDLRLVKERLNDPLAALEMLRIWPLPLPLCEHMVLTHGEQLFVKAPNRHVWDSLVLAGATNAYFTALLLIAPRLIYRADDLVADCISPSPAACRPLADYALGHPSILPKLKPGQWNAIFDACYRGTPFQQQKLILLFLANRTSVGVVVTHPQIGKVGIASGLVDLMLLHVAQLAPVYRMRLPQVSNRFGGRATNVWYQILGHIGR